MALTAIACRDRRREEEAMRWHRWRRAPSVSTRNRRQPFGLRAAPGRLRCRRSSAMSRIACVAAASHTARRRTQRHAPDLFRGSL